MTVSLRKQILDSRVSSVLNRDAKQFGKKHLFDGNSDTCWNSDQGESQWVKVDFNDLMVIEKLTVQFQGGFACKELDVLDAEDAIVHTFYPEDTSKRQTFEFDEKLAGYSVKLVFKACTDFYGRVTIYDLDFFGVE